MAIWSGKARQALEERLRKLEARVAAATGSTPCDPSGSLEKRMGELEVNLTLNEHMPAKQAGVPAQAKNVADGDDGSVFDIGELRFTRLREENVRNIRKRSRAVFLGEDLVLCRALGRYKMYVAASDVGFGAHLVLDGFWEFPITEFMTRNVQTGMTVLDLGANFGYYTLIMADLVGPNGHVHSFEPNPTALDRLMRSVEINGYASRVFVDSRALSRRSGDTLIFRIPDREPKNGGIVQSVEDIPGVSHISVETVALNDLAIEGVGFAKVDVEGAEEHLWHGMQDFRRRNPNMLLLLEFACGRCVEPAATLESIEGVYPLRYLDENSVARRVTREQLLSRSEDWMLVLTHGPIVDPL